MKPLVSVIVTSYNQSNTIRHTLDLIISQKCSFHFEIIIGDDCSSDGTRELILSVKKQYPEKIITILHDENIGVAANFAICVKSALGKYIAICAADDYWHNPLKLQLQVNFFEQNTDYGLVYSDYDKLNSKSGRLVRNYLKKTKKEIFTGEGLMSKFIYGQVPALTLTVMFRKDLFDRYIPVDDYIKCNFTLEDWPTWLIMSKYTKVGFIKESTATYRYGYASISNPQFYKKIEERFAKEHKMVKYLSEMFPEEMQYNETIYLAYINHILLNLAYKKIDFHKAKEFSIKLNELGINNIKTKLAKDRFLFYTAALIKSFKSMIYEA